MRCKRCRCSCSAALSGGRSSRRAKKNGSRRPGRSFISSAPASPVASSGSSSLFRRSPSVRFTRCRRATRSECCRRSGPVGFPGTRPADRRTAHVGAHVPDLSRRDFRQIARWFGEAPPAPRNPKTSNGTHPEQSHEDWELLPAEQLPRPNYFPAGLAMGTTFFFWGFITSWIILRSGPAFSLPRWPDGLSEIRHERNHA